MPEPRLRRLVLLALLALLLWSSAAGAHLLKVFAWAEGDTLHGRVYFAGGAAATGAQVTVYGTDGERLAELTPDAAGEFSHTVSAPVDLRIVADTREGHRAEWRLAAAELAGASPAPAAAGPADDPPPTTAAGVSQAQLNATVERAVARQLGPLRAELKAYAEGARLGDVVGGIGVIFGIAGVAMWWRCRRGDRK